MEMLATLAGTLEWFNLTGMASGPVTHSVIYEATGQSFRIPLLLMAASNGAQQQLCLRAHLISHRILATVRSGGRRVHVPRSVLRGREGKRHRTGG